MSDVFIRRSVYHCVVDVCELTAGPTDPMAHKQLLENSCEQSRKKLKGQRRWETASAVFPQDRHAPQPGRSASAPRRDRCSEFPAGRSQGSVWGECTAQWVCQTHQCLILYSQALSISSSLPGITHQLDGTSDSSPKVNLCLIYSLTRHSNTYTHNSDTLIHTLIHNTQHITTSIHIQTHALESRFTNLSRGPDVTVVDKYMGLMGQLWTIYFLCKWSYKSSKRHFKGKVISWEMSPVFKDI